MHIGDGLGGEGFVDFDEIEVCDGAVEFVCQFAHGVNRRAEDFKRIDGSLRIANNASQWFESVGVGERTATYDKRRCAIANRRRIPRRHGSRRVEDRFQRGQRRGGRVCTRRLIGDDGYGFTPLRHRDGCELGGKMSVLLGSQGAAVAFQRPGVLRGAADVIAAGDPFGAVSHVMLLKGTPQPVLDHGVEQGLVVEAVTEACAGQQVGGQVHIFHTTGQDQAGVTGADGLRRHHHRLQTAAADFVDRRCTDRRGDARPNRRLPRWGLPNPGLKDVAHQHFVHRSGINAGAFHGSADRRRAQFRRGDCLKRPLKFADWGACCADDDYIVIGHRFISTIMGRVLSSVRPIRPAKVFRRGAVDRFPRLRARRGSLLSMWKVHC